MVLSPGPRSWASDPSRDSPMYASPAYDPPRVWLIVRSEILGIGPKPCYGPDPQVRNSPVYDSSCVLGRGIGALSVRCEVAVAVWLWCVARVRSWCIRTPDTQGLPSILPDRIPAGQSGSFITIIYCHFVPDFCANLNSSKKSKKTLGRRQFFWLQSQLRSFTNCADPILLLLGDRE